MSIIPTSRPEASQSQIRALLKARGVSSPVALVAVRGYYSETFAPAGNNRGVYDDAMFVVTPESVVPFNANADPSIFRKGIAMLKTGVHLYKKGLHGLSWKAPRKPYRAFRPATGGERVPVTRDQTANPRDGVAINIHKGGKNNTYSEGCQTLPPDQWEIFQPLVYLEMDRAGIKVLPLVLVNRAEFDAIKEVAAPDMASLENVLRIQMTRDHALTGMLLSGASKYQLPAAFVLAIASRETGIVNTVGDGGHGRGVMQIDDRYHDVARTTDFYKEPGVMINYACAMLEDDLLWARRNWPKYTEPQHLKIAAAAYNRGQGGAKKGIVEGDADKYTAHGNYGADILKRMEVFEKLLREDEFAQ